MTRRLLIATDLDRTLLPNGPQTESPGARELFGRACDAGDSFGCYNLAVAFARPIGGAEPDHTRARALFTQACEGDVVAACNNLGLMLSQGIGGDIYTANMDECDPNPCDAGNCVRDCEQVSYYVCE